MKLTGSQWAKVVADYYACRMSSVADAGGGGLAARRRARERRTRRRQVARARAVGVRRTRRALALPCDREARRARAVERRPRRRERVLARARADGLRRGGRRRPREARLARRRVEVVGVRPVRARIHRVASGTWTTHQSVVPCVAQAVCLRYTARRRV